MTDNPRKYVIIWVNWRTGAQEPMPVDKEQFFGFVKSMAVLEEVWNESMKSSRENALHWSGKENDNGDLG